ncbi:Acetylornithine aminotransferase [hydrothermal vent metagenome]|uniref:Acetylornithine aminotransferase n=1 Tax=hydrothermal vent metagenome TaxID=652676 RepID=A0A3B1D0N5_9ZZZZ
METKDIKGLATKYLTRNYSRQPIVLVKGRRSSVWDAEGKKYLDFVSGIAVMNLGHNFSPVNKAIQKQMSTLAHVSNLYYTEPQVEYAQALVDKMHKGKLFFCNSGAEATEAALKLARRHSIETTEDKARTEIIAFKGSFHGRTMGALSLTGQDGIKKEGFGPMLSGVKFVTYGDIDAVEKAITKKTCAVIIEPIQGEGGVNVPKHSFMQGLAKLCTANKLQLIFDEVQTGFGRTGKLFAFEHFRVKPGIVIMAKGIANGYPMGVMFAKDDVAKSFVPGTHASTFGGSPPACAGALAALEEITKPELLENVRNMGRYMLLKLTGMKRSVPTLKQVRGIGLMIGVELGIPGEKIVKECANTGLLLSCANEKVIRFLPPLNVTKQEVDKALNIFGKVLGV